MSDWSKDAIKDAIDAVAARQSVRKSALSAALARADQELALVRGGLTQLVREAHDIAETEGATQAWVIMSVRVTQALDCHTPNQQFAVKLLIAAILDLGNPAS